MIVGDNGTTEPAHQTTDQEQPESHECRTDQENRATTPAVDKENRRNGHEDVEDILDRGGLEGGVLTFDTSALEDKDDVVHGDVHARELRPGLERHSKEDATDSGLAEKFHVRSGCEGAVKVDGVLNFLVLGLDSRIVLVTISTEVC